MKYFIEHNQYTDAKGKPTKAYFRVYHMRKFLGLIPYRKYAVETMGEKGYRYTTSIRFKTKGLAEKFIKEVLCAGITPGCTRRYTIKAIHCNCERHESKIKEKK